MKKNTILKDALILIVITLIAGGLLGLVYEVTKKPIANQQEKAKQEAYKAVFEDADSFEVCVEAEDADLAEALKEQGFEAQKINESKGCFRRDFRICCQCDDLRRLWRRYHLFYGSSA